MSRTSTSQFGEKGETGNSKKDSLRNATELPHSPGQQHYLCLAPPLETPTTPYHEVSPHLFFKIREGGALPGILAVGDDAALNGIHLLCTDGTVTESSMGKAATSGDPEGKPAQWYLHRHPYPLGRWLPVLLEEVIEVPLATKCGGLGKRCSICVMTQQPTRLRFTCTDGTKLEGLGVLGDHFGAWSSTCTSEPICGLQTKVEEPPGIGDDTALNDIRVFCCE
ncbi:PREDICTED: vitelline membrane outer layer protein 1-like [Apaloderma vittatum]|uniref:vitelline membrane outer layer protein 1-like n=1 Tax=Apaloderma vittatum TaxID=57397 RepID=UPI000521A2BF|nr:PREDICTED: vitelline membrane outer layer protein 1-like [Apaloderma vittatum]